MLLNTSLATTATDRFCDQSRLVGLDLSPSGLTVSCIGGVGSVSSSERRCVTSAWRYAAAVMCMPERIIKKALASLAYAAQYYPAKDAR